MIALGPLRFPCALGRSGRGLMKREGDGLTPIGAWAVRAVYYRADRIARPRGGVRTVRLAPEDGWCDAPDDRNYNRRVRHPYPASAERLWRDDGLYDVIVVLGFNDRPRRRGRGSAIFMHVARPGFRPTAGCVALRLPDLLRLIERLGTHGIVRVEG
ncbi:MAG: L,D-transpeptidase family protein [Hyphomicrobiaceae bacterium]